MSDLAVLEVAAEFNTVDLSLVAAYCQLSDQQIRDVLKRYDYLFDTSTGRHRANPVERWRVIDSTKIGEVVEALRSEREPSLAASDLAVPRRFMTEQAGRGRDSYALPNSRAVDSAGDLSVGSSALAKVISLDHRRSDSQHEQGRVEIYREDRLSATGRAGPVVDLRGIVEREIEVTDMPHGKAVRSRGRRAREHLGIMRRLVSSTRRHGTS